MPEAPHPITSPPAQPGQPYDATRPGAGEPQTESTTIYDAAGGSGSSEPWIKVRDGGDADSPGSWPDNGASSDGGWKQT